MKVELVFDAGCPNVQRARADLRDAFREVGLAPRWVERRRDDPETPEDRRAFGSPTVLVDGVDVAPDDPNAAPHACRLYPDGDGRARRSPDPDMIARSLRRAIDGRFRVDRATPHDRTEPT